MKRLLVVSLLLVLTWIPFSQGLKKPLVGARKEDIPFIRCQVCEKLGAQLYDLLEKKQAEIAPKKISEYQIIELAENVCNLKKAEADWILNIDIVEQGDRLELEEQESEGQCNSECKTIERACQEVMGYSDTDVAEYLFKYNPRAESLINYLCKDLTGACRANPPPVPKDRTPGEEFVPKSSKEAEMEKIMKSMEGMPGAPGMKMYSRDDLMNMKNFGDEDADEDDDDDGEDKFSSKLGKIMKEKESRKSDWKHRISEGISKTGDALKKHANKASIRLGKWWKSFTQGKIMKEKESRKSDWKHRISEGISKTGDALKKHANKASIRLRKWWKAKTAGSKKKKASKTDL